MSELAWELTGLERVSDLAVRRPMGLALRSRSVWVSVYRTVLVWVLEAALQSDLVWERPASASG